jgi:translation initiation factor 2-alpha kinase 4
LAKFLSKSPDARGRSGEVPLDLNPPKLSQTDGTTGVCGTSFYIAPEVESESRSYTEKVDIFSVGIIVVELWTRFSTEMERIVTLRDLRESGKLPRQFAEEHPNAAALASWLLETDPGKRPTAHEALKSNLIPTTIGNEQLSDLLRSLPDNPQARVRCSYQIGCNIKYYLFS